MQSDAVLLKAMGSRYYLRMYLHILTSTGIIEGQESEDSDTRDLAPSVHFASQVVQGVGTNFRFLGDTPPLLLQFVNTFVQMSDFSFVFFQ